MVASFVMHSPAAILLQQCNYAGTDSNMEDGRLRDGLVESHVGKTAGMLFNDIIRTTSNGGGNYRKPVQY